MPTPVFRFAPSPNGYLHLGHARSALLNFDLARRHHGRFLLRIEDIDAFRCRPEYEHAIYDDLTWLGVKWEAPVLRQSARLPLYEAAMRKLDAAGLVYPAFESRAEIDRLVTERETGEGSWPRDPDGAPLYAGSANSIPRAQRVQRAKTEPHVLRLDMAGAVARAGALDWCEIEPSGLTVTEKFTAAPAAWGDVVLARKDIPTSYHLAVVIDDSDQRVTHVVRGRDLFWSTSIHRLLQHLLDLPPPHYHHHELILDVDGRKLSKSSRSTALRALRADGATPGDIRRLIGHAP
jgi:glutamyl-Q tRNA(Asp) synthetase